MGIEIERKFLVGGEGWREGPPGKLYVQGYLSTDPARTVRVRIAGDVAFLTIKGRTVGASRAEFEYEIPRSDAEEILRNLAYTPLIEKTRYERDVGGMIWVVDEFHGENNGLLLAEVELNSENQSIVLPRWVGEEVTSDERYFNAYLSRHPYQTWKSQG